MYLTTEEIAVELKVHPNTVRYLTKKGALKSVKVGSQNRYDLDKVKAALEAAATKEEGGIENAD